MILSLAVLKLLGNFDQHFFVNRGIIIVSKNLQNMLKVSLDIYSPKAFFSEIEIVLSILLFVQHL